MKRVISARAAGTGTIPTSEARRSMLAVADYVVARNCDDGSSRILDQIGGESAAGAACDDEH
jgi:hypothetical protein